MRLTTLVVATIVTLQSAQVNATWSAPPAERSAPSVPLLGALAQGPAAAEPPPANDLLEPIRGAQRSARAAILMTIPVPGWGQLYSDAPFWGILGFAVQSYYLGRILMENRRQSRQRAARDLETDDARRAVRELFIDEHGERARDNVWWASGAFLILALDAYVSVQLADFDSGGPPTPDLDRDWSGDDGEDVSMAVHFSF